MMMMKRKLSGGSVARLLLAALCVAGGLALPSHSRAAAETATACARLSDFVNHTRAQSGKKLTTAQANQLIEEANAIRALLGCS